MLYAIIYEIFMVEQVMIDGMEYAFSVAGYETMFITNLARLILFYALFYIFRAFGLYKMAKNRGIDKAYLAFIPFACFILVGKLQPSGKFNLKTNKFYIVALVCSSLYFALNLCIDIIYAQKPLAALLSGVKPTADDFAGNVFLYNALVIFEEIAGYAYLIFSIFVYANVYKSFAPQKVAKYTFITILVYLITGNLFMAGIFLFINRNAAEINYDDYVIGLRGRYYYGNGTNMYGNNYTRKNENRDDGDPFADFETKKNDDPFADFGTNDYSDKRKTKRKDDDSDDLF